MQIKGKLPFVWNLTKCHSPLQSHSTTIYVNHSQVSKTAPLISLDGRHLEDKVIKTTAAFYGCSLFSSLGSLSGESEVPCHKHIQAAPWWGDYPRPVANSHVSEHLGSSNSSPSQAFGWLQSQLTAWLQSHGSSRARTTQAALKFHRNCEIIKVWFWATEYSHNLLCSTR